MTVATATLSKFTDAETAKAVEAYRASPTAETVAALATELGRSIAAIRGKLVSEKVYVAKTAAKAADKRETKAEMLAATAAKLGLSAEALASLEKGSVESIKALRDAVAELTKE